MLGCKTLFRSRPGELGAVCGLRAIETTAAAEELSQPPIGTGRVDRDKVTATTDEDIARQIADDVVNDTAAQRPPPAARC